MHFRAGKTKHSPVLMSSRGVWALGVFCRGCGAVLATFSDVQ